MLQHLTYRIDFNTPSISGNENDTAKLLILESLFIQEQTPDFNNDSQSRHLIIFKIQLICLRVLPGNIALKLFFWSCNYINLNCDSGCFALLVFSTFLKQQYYNFAVENDALKAVKIICIFKINITDCNFHAHLPKSLVCLIFSQFFVSYFRDMKLNEHNTKMKALQW